ncbi:GumC family protein [Aliagarivorans taiwanensis]|uniref:GumC family protein n=1 Tax=Aliagarivorans taiwanensis TaxID=561966 RepID=UPI0004043DB8|nr:polysaccharide biosynthesis tyrosine autokinase [Aliagarivorans taiwanensis]
MNNSANVNLHAVDGGNPSLTNSAAAVSQPAMPQEELIDLRQYLSAIGKRWPMILGFTFLAALLATLVAFSIIPVYRATAVLLIEAEQRSAVSIEQVIGVDTSKQEYYLTQFELLKSRSIAEKVIARYGLEELPEFNGEREPTWLDQVKNPIGSLRTFASDSPLLQSWLPEQEPATEAELQEARKQHVMGTFSDRLTISPVRKTQLVKISFDSEDRHLAATLANAVGEAYIENNREARLLASQEATSWLEDRLGKLRAAVTASEDRLTAFLQQEGLVDVEGIDSLASTELSDLSRRLSDARDRRVAAESLYFVLQDNRNAGLAQLSSVPAISNHPQLRDVRLAEIEAERLVSELSKRYGPKHDRMIQARAQLATVQQRATELLSDLASGIEKELRSARKQENALQAELDSKKGQFQGIAVKRATYDALKREVDSNRKLYDLFLNRQKETAATNDFQTAVARFTDRASVPLSSTSPRRKVIVIGVASLALLITCVISLLQDSIRDTVDTSNDVRELLRLDPIGVVPLLKRTSLSDGVVSDNLVTGEKGNEVNEAIRGIRTSILFKMAPLSRKLVSITSSVPGEGKTTMAIGLSLSIAKMEKTILVDCDLRKPSVGERFGIGRSSIGLTNYLMMGADLRDCIHTHKHSGLDILTAGMIAPNPQELLSSVEFKSLVDRLLADYDKVLFDTPPLSAVSDALIVGGVVGSSILVINSRKTKKNEVSESVSLLVNHGVLMEGVVLNKVRKTSSSYYSYTYG